MHLKEVGIDEERIDSMADHILKYDSTSEEWMYHPLDKKYLVKILKESM